MAYTIVGFSRTRVATKEKEKKIISVNLSADEFIFSQASIVSSVSLEDNTHFIHPSTQKFVNNNGDCFSNPSMKANYKSFVGAYNYVNHVQKPEKAIGFIADAALRKIHVDPKEPKLAVYYCDILVATHRDNQKIASLILNDSIKYLSMGCDAFVSTCSKCGHVFSEDYDLCECLTEKKGKYYVDDNGKKRIVAEILGTEKPGTVNFIEASYLTEVPAFHGAVKRNVLKIPKGVSIELEFNEDDFKKEAVQKYLKGR